MKVLMYDHYSASRADLLRRHLQTEWEVLTLPDPSDRARAQALVGDADAFIGNEFPADLLPAARKLRLVHCVGAGVDKFDPHALPAGSVLCNVYEHEIPIAEYVMMCCLMHATRIDGFRRTFREGAWDGSARAEGVFHGEIHGHTLGILGFGHIGRMVAARGRAFGMRVVALTRHPPMESWLDWCGGLDQLPELLGRADYLVIACPLTERTRGMIGADQFAQMKREAFLINIARAEIVDEQALFDALSSGRIAGAAIDVWYQYPPEPRRRLHGSRLPFHEVENVIATPHLCAWTEPMIERRYRRIAGNLDRFARGEPLESVVLRR